MVFATNLLLYIISFAVIWFGSGLIIASTGKFSKRLRLSSFTFSFVFLGILTSIPEFSVGLQAVADNDPEIFVGNLLGGITVVFLLIIPVLAVFGNGINLRHELGAKTLLFAMFVMLSPAFFVLDKKVSMNEGVILILLYVVLLLIVQRKNGIFDTENTNMLEARAYSAIDILKILVGIGLVFISSSIIVDKTLYFAEVFNISAFYISLVVIAIGTNLPELSIAVRSVVTGKKEIAMGDYLGSASANTLLFGVFTVLHNGEVLTESNFFIPFFFILTALVFFYVLSRTKQYISRRDGIVFLVVYFLFLAVEFIR